MQIFTYDGSCSDLRAALLQGHLIWSLGQIGEEKNTSQQVDWRHFRFHCISSVCSCARALRPIGQGCGKVPCPRRPIARCPRCQDCRQRAHDTNCTKLEDTVKGSFEASSLLKRCQLGLSGQSVQSVIDLRSWKWSPTSEDRILRRHSDRSSNSSSEKLHY